MSQENVEIGRAALAAFNRRDKAAWLEICDPEFENVPPADFPESAATRGPEAVWDFYVEAQDPWEGAVFELGEVLDAGDKLVHEIRANPRGKASGAGVAWRYWQVLTFRRAKIVHSVWFTERAEALEAAGLSE